MKKTLATGISEYDWRVVILGEVGTDSGVLVVSDRRDGEKIISLIWSKFEPPTDDEKKALLNLYIQAYCKGVGHGTEAKLGEIRAALGFQ